MLVLRSLLGCMLIAGCTPAAPQGQAVAPEVYIAAIRGNTQVGNSREGGANWRIYVAEDLTRRGVIIHPRGQFAITGRVAAGPTGVCSSAPEVRDGEERCFQIFRHGDVYESVYNGTVDSTLRIVPGNPYNF